MGDPLGAILGDGEEVNELMVAKETEAGVLPACRLQGEVGGGNGVQVSKDVILVKWEKQITNNLEVSNFQQGCTV